MEHQEYLSTLSEVAITLAGFMGTGAVSKIDVFRRTYRIDCRYCFGIEYYKSGVNLFDWVAWQIIVDLNNFALLLVNDIHTSDKLAEII